MPGEGAEDDGDDYDEDGFKRTPVPDASELQRSPRPKPPADPAPSAPPPEPVRSIFSGALAATGAIDRSPSPTKQGLAPSLSPRLVPQRPRSPPSPRAGAGADTGGLLAPPPASGAAPLQRSSSLNRGPTGRTGSDGNGTPPTGGAAGPLAPAGAGAAAAASKDKGSAGRGSVRRGTFRAGAPPAIQRQDSDATIQLGSVRVRSGRNDTISAAFNPYSDDHLSRSGTITAGFYESQLGMSLAEWMYDMDSGYVSAQRGRLYRGARGVVAHVGGVRWVVPGHPRRDTVGPAGPGNGRAIANPLFGLDE